MPQLTFDQPNSQLPIRTLQKQDINQAGFAALGNSVSRAGVQVLRDDAANARATAVLAAATEKRRRETEAYKGYLEAGLQAQETIKTMEESGVIDAEGNPTTDPMQVQKFGPGVISTPFEAGRQKSIEGGYEREYLGHAVPLQLSLQGSFLNTNAAKILPAQIAEMEQAGAIMVSQVS